MQWIYLSPHFDDIALSCAGLLWEQTHAGDATSVWTICAAEPLLAGLSAFAEELHRRWQAGPRARWQAHAAAQRRKEDARSCKTMGADRRLFEVPDCIYRLSLQGEHLYASEEALFGDLRPEETGLVETLSARLASRLPVDAQVVCPLAIGGHVDHRLTRRATEMLGRPMWYYADYPYVAARPEALDELQSAGWRSTVFPVSAQGLKAWQRAIAAHASQLSSFWPDEAAMRQAMRSYCLAAGGVKLWKVTNIT